MTAREATCRCGQLRVETRGDPVRVSVCHCLNCQKRSGSSFAAQARWRDEDVTVSGEAKTWVATGETGDIRFRFCPECGSTVFYQAEGLPGLTAVAIGAFSDPTFRQPDYSVYESRKHAWVEIVGEGIERF